MKSSELFSSGKIIDTFIHINPNDLENEYFGHYVQYENSVYEIIIDSNNNLVSPDSDARLITDDINKMYEMGSYDYEEEHESVIEELNNMNNQSMYSSMQYKKYQDMFRNK